MAWSINSSVDTADSTGFLIASYNGSNGSTPFDETTITWNEIFSSTSEEIAGFYLTVDASSGVRALVHVAVGSIGSEQIIATVPAKMGEHWENNYQVPVSIPAGSRVSVGAATQDHTRSIYVQLAGLPSSAVPQLPPFTRMDCGPFDLTASFHSYGQPMEIDPGTTANTKGVWTELSMPSFTGNLLNGDSLANDYDWLGFMSTYRDSYTGAKNMLWDFSNGAAGAEGSNIMVENLMDYMSGLEHGALSHKIQWFPASAVVGQRISARMQSSTIDSWRVSNIWMFGLR